LPRSVAVVGASGSSRVGRGSLQNLQRLGFEGALYPVNPKHEFVLGLPCYPTVEAIPAEVDAVLVATTADRAIQVLEQCARKGVGGVVVGTDGFGERDERGAVMESRLREIALAADIALCGPNCMGILNLANGGALYIGVLDGPMRRGSVAVVLQSGSLGLALANNDRGLDFRYLISSGNEAATSAADYVGFLAEDPGTSVIGLVLEGIRDPELLLDCSRRAILAGKPVVLLKLGTSEKGRGLAASHTGALAGSGAVSAAVCRQYGITLVGDLEELVSTCLLMAQSAPPAGSRAGVVTLSGGSGVLFADLAAERGIQLPEWQPDTASSLEGLTGRRPANPVDVWSAGDFAATAGAAATSAAADSATDFVVLLQDLPPEGAPHRGDVPSAIVDVASQVRAATSKPVLVWGSVWSRPDPALAEVLREKRVPYLTGGRSAMSALAGWAGRTTSEAAARSRPPLSRPAHSGSSNVWDRNVLTTAGIPMVDEVFAANAAAAEAAASRLGYPVVLKIVSPQINHKSEVGGVIRGLREGEVGPAFERMTTTVAMRSPGSTIEGVIVQPEAPIGLEMVVGAIRDPDWGWVVTAGMGGVMVEVLRDTAFRRAPIDHQSAVGMLRDLRGWPLLAGHRGQPSRDVEALAELVYKVAGLVSYSGAGLTQLDLNPVLVYEQGKGVVVVDSLLVAAGAVPLDQLS
jgi:acyl-CoA synthetase (NDP forming)